VSAPLGSPIDLPLDSFLLGAETAPRVVVREVEDLRRAPDEESGDELLQQRTVVVEAVSLAPEPPTDPPAGGE
jgi:hypothetical protein